MCRPAPSTPGRRTSSSPKSKSRLNLRGPRGPQNPELVRRRAESWAARCRAAPPRVSARRPASCTRRRSAPSGGLHALLGRGAKGRNTIKFTNSDPQMALFFRRFLTDALAIELDEIVMTLNVYTNNGMTIEEIERYWLDLLGLPATAVRKHTLNHMPTSSSGQAKNKLPYGVCTLELAAPGCSSTSMARFRSTPASTSRLGWTSPGGRPAGAPSSDWAPVAQWLRASDF